jgi:hypothetical protein
MSSRFVVGQFFQSMAMTPEAKSVEEQHTPLPDRLQFLRSKDCVILMRMAGKIS